MLAFRKAERETEREGREQVEWREGGERGFLLFLWHQQKERRRAEIVALGNEGATLYSDPSRRRRRIDNFRTHSPSPSQYCDGYVKSVNGGRGRLLRPSLSPFEVPLIGAAKRNAGGRL